MATAQGNEQLYFQGQVFDRDTDAGISGLWVEAYSHQGERLGEGQTERREDRDGRFRFELDRGKLSLTTNQQPYFRVKVSDQAGVVLYNEFLQARWETRNQVLHADISVSRPVVAVPVERIAETLDRINDKLPPADQGWPADDRIVDALDNINSRLPEPEQVVAPLEDIATYMPTGYETSGPGGRPRPAGGGTTGALQDIIDRELVAVLGGRWKQTEDAKPEGKSVLSALARSFPAEQRDDRTTYRFVPRAFAVHTELGGTVTGAQASLYRRAKAAIDDALPLLDALEPQESNGADDEDVTATRQIVRKEFGELVNELGREGGPRVPRVDEIFRLLRDYLGDPAQPDDLGRLGEVFGLDLQHVTTIEEEQNFTNYLVIRDYVHGLEATWIDGNRQQFLGGPAARPFLGTQFLLLERTLTTTAEQVEETYRAMESVGLGPAERRTVIISFDGLLPRMTVDELLSWVAQFATDEGPTLIREGGRDGVRAIQPVAARLHQLVNAASQVAPQDGAPVGLTRGRVRRGLQELAGQLARVDQLARELLI